MTSNIEAFHRSAARRQIWISVLAGLACLAFGIVFAYLALSMEAPARVAGRKWGTAIGGVALIGAGLRMLYRGIAAALRR